MKFVTLFNLPSLPSLSERSTCRVDRDGNLAMEGDDLGVSGNSERVQSVVELWMTGGETERSFVRRWSTEPFYPVSGGGCLLPPSLYFRADLICGFVPSSDCQR